LVSVISPNVVNELRFQVPFRSSHKNRFEATGSGPAITIPGVANFGNSLDVGFRFDEMTPEVSENFSYNLAQHALKFAAASAQSVIPSASHCCSLHLSKHCRICGGEGRIKPAELCEFYPDSGRAINDLQLPIQWPVRARHVEATSEHHRNIWRAL